MGVMLTTILSNMLLWKHGRNTRPKLPTRYALRGRESPAGDDHTMEQPISKSLARHPLVLLDQQLKKLGKEDDVGHKENARDSDVEGRRFRMRCWKCAGLLKPEEDVDLRGGVSIQHYACLRCGRRWYGGERSTPAIAA